MNASPLGRYSEPAALVVALALVAVWLAVQVGLLAPPGPTGALDTAAALAIGLVLGQRSTTNGAGKVALAAHARLDSMGAPAANDGIGNGPGSVRTTTTTTTAPPSTIPQDTTRQGPTGLG